MKPRTVAKLILSGGAVLAGLLALELAVRAISTRDEDGRVKVRQTTLKPYRVGVRKAGHIVDQYLASDRSVLIHDAELGWTMLPGVAMHNRFGFITSHDPTPEPPEGTLRIALFGGSYTLGTFDTGWWRVLERELNASGIKAEVLNFGVSAYGMDQAFLRWRRDGRTWKPHVVVFGWVAGNCYDNVNLVRMLQHPDTEVPFTKPRFVLKGDTIELINSPTPSPSEIPALMRNLAAWPPIAHDHFYDPGDFQMTWWRMSRLGALIEASVLARSHRNNPEALYRLDSEPSQLALAIVRQFQKEAEAAGSTFLVARLPHFIDLQQKRATGRFPDEDLFDELRKSVRTIQPENAMLERCGSRNPNDLFWDGHYNTELHEVTGLEVAKVIRELAPPPAK